MVCTEALRHLRCLRIHKNDFPEVGLNVSPGVVKRSLVNIEKTVKQIKDSVAYG